MVSNYISTVSGRRFYFGDHAAMVEAIEIEDIGHALANLCRFTGQCRRFYSVAEHSVHVSYIVPDDLALVGLLHDATEAYCADLARPLKQLVPDYRAIEDSIWLAVAEKFGLPVSMPELIKRADMQMLKLEVKHLLPEHCLHELNLPGDFPPSHIGLRYYAPAYAKYRFMERYKELAA